MKAAPWWTRGCVVIMWAMAGMSVQAIADEGPAEVPDEPEIEQPEADLDDGPDSDVADPVAKASDLAEQYGVTPEQVTAMRTTDSMGWGEVEIALALADNLAKADPEDAVDMNAALTQVMDARAAGTGWGKIAKDMGLQLGDVVSDVKSGRPDKAGHHVEKPEKVGKPDKPEKPGKPEMMEKPERPAKVGKPEKPDKPEKPETPDKPDKAEKPDKPERGNKP